MKRKIKDGILALIGYILSPFSWWNDFFINIPLAYIFALPFYYISKSWFLPAIIAGYWITNILGFILIHHGVTGLVSRKNKKYTNKEIVKDIIISIIYTMVVACLVLKGWLRFPAEYFH